MMNNRLFEIQSEKKRLRDRMADDLAADSARLVCETDQAKRPGDVARHHAV
jgi:hypothetical protein